MEEGIQEHDKRLAALEGRHLALVYVELARHLKQQIAFEVTLLSSENLEGKYLTGELRYTTETLTFEELKCSISDDQINDSQPGLVRSSIYLWEPVRSSNPLLNKTYNLWHAIMTEVLRHACPEVFET